MQSLNAPPPAFMMKCERVCKLLVRIADLIRHISYISVNYLSSTSDGRSRTSQKH